MKITYLGHAGFCVETAKTIIIIDPWLSETGAFDASWFQYPKNHHMQAFVRDTLANTQKDTYIYISHEHQDHFDIDFLESIPSRSFTLILAKFDHSVIQYHLEARHFQCANTLILSDEEAYSFQDGSLRLFVMDTEMNCDSAILIQSGEQRFLNINDCKIHDRLPAIVEKYGKIDVFAAQFSGASWYPTCYQMPEAAYRQLSERKVADKFESIAKAIEIIRPSVYWPSAGPPCFLDPMLMEINFQVYNTYPRAPALIRYLDKRLHAMAQTVSWKDVNPGDSLELGSLEWTRYQSLAESEVSFESYIRAYALEKKELFDRREAENKYINPQDVFEQLQQNLEEKIQALKWVHQTVTTPLYWRLKEYPLMYRIDFAHKTLQVVSEITDADGEQYVRITAPAWQVRKVLTKEISWPDFALTLRLTLERVPNVYNTVVHGFLMLPAEKISSFCEKVADNRGHERIIIDYQGKKYSILRYCPHQGADLALSHMEGPYLVCPRHQWRFDIEQQGQCIHNHSCIEAIYQSDDELSSCLHE